MEIDIAIYLARICTFIVKRTVMQTAASYEVEMTGTLFWFPGLLIMKFLVIGDVLLKLGLLTGQEKMHHIMGVGISITTSQTLTSE
jgi:hypothetical protein